MSETKVIGKHHRAPAVKKTTIVGHNAISLHEGCFVLGDNCVTTHDNQCVIGETVFGKPLNKEFREIIIKYPRFFEEFILMLVYHIHGNNREP